MPYIPKSERKIVVCGVKMELFPDGIGIKVPNRAVAKSLVDGKLPRAGREKKVVCDGKKFWLGQTPDYRKGKQVMVWWLHSASG